MRKPTDDEIEDARIEAIDERTRWNRPHLAWCMSRLGGVMPCDCRAADEEEDSDDA